MKVMQGMGFGSKWRRWIWWCISTAKFSVLVNGVPAGFFSSSRGLRQGDPLSPYLFILGMEVLSVLLRRAVARGFISGCTLTGKEGSVCSISRLLFADDMLVFCKASKDQLIYLRWVLFWFEASSGLKINLDKSEIYMVGDVDNLDSLATVLGYRTGQLPSTYLGLSLGAPHKLVAAWDAIEERMRKKLALWKRNYSSKGGRLTLIKSTLASLPIYQLSLVRMPISVAKRLENLQRNFLWGGGALEKKPHLVNWDVICSNKGQGSLGLRSLTSLNKVLLGKWIWRFAS